MSLLKITTGKDLYTVLMLVFGLLLLLAAFISDQDWDEKELIVDEEILFFGESSFKLDNSIADDELEKFWLGKYGTAAQSVFNMT